MIEFTKEEKVIETKVCIIGAGPAGTTTALYLEKMGISSLLVDKATFPRHKTCGEAMRVNVHFVLKDLNPDYLKELEHSLVLKSSKLRLIANNGRDLSLHLGRAFSYLGKRYEFDNFLISKVKSKSSIQLIENQPITKIKKTTNGYILSDKTGNFQVETQMIVFAAGSNNSLQKQIETIPQNTNNKILGVRAYFKNVSFPDDTTHIYFFKKLHGGYLWAFPLPGNNANIGMAIKADKIKAHKINLRTLFEETVQHERLQPFLKNAVIDSTIGGATVLLPTMGQSLSGEGYVLAGDSGLAINPITGFGVGHAMKMGRYAAKQVERCLSANDFSGAFMKQYDEEVYKMMGEEVEGGLKLTNLLKKTWLVNGLIRFFGGSQRFRKLFENPTLADNLNNPTFIFRELFMSN